MLNKLFRRRPLIEELEPRILYSADLAPFALDSLAPAPEQRIVNVDGEFASVTATTRNELVIVDSGVQDYETLLADILEQAGSDRHFSVVILDSNRDGIEQISDVLKQYGNLDAVHLISHGGPGSLQLGNSQLDATSLDSRAAEIAIWGNAFNADADWLIYGCDVAAGPEGESFLSTLSRLVGTDVAASLDPTGSTLLGGNWALEFTTGRIESVSAIGASGPEIWVGTLAITQSGVNSMASSGAVSTLSFSHTVDAGSDRLLLVEIAVSDSTAVSSVSYNSDALTLVDARNASSGVRVELWALIAPPVGSGTVTVNLGATQNVVAGATTFYGVHQTTPLGAPVSTFGNGGTPSVTVASASGELVVDVAATLGVGSYTVGANQTALFATSQGSTVADVWAISSTEAGAASVVMSHTAGTDKWAAIAVAIKPSGAAMSAPVITTSGTLAYTENQAATAIDPALTVTDSDSTNLTGATVSLSTNYASGQDVLAFTDQLGISGSWDAGTGVLTLTGTSSVANYETALRSVTYINTSDSPSTLVRTVSFVVNDGTSPSAAAARTVTVEAVNDAPINTVPGAQSTAKNTTLNFSVANGNAFAVSDVDAGGASVQTTLTVTSGVLSAGAGTTGVTVAGSGTTLTLSGTLAQINNLLAGNLDGSLSFSPTTGFTGSVALTFTTNDLGSSGSGGAQADTDVISIAVTDASLWLSTDGSATSSAGSGSLSWADGQVVNFGNPNLVLGSTTTGTFSTAVKLAQLADDGGIDIKGLHYVSQDTIVGTTTPITLLASDVLFSVDANETFGGINVTKQDIVLFRPTTPGDFSSGSFQIVLRNPGGTGNDVRDFALVEAATTVGGTALQKGDFLLLLSSGSYDKDVWLFRATTTGTTTSGAPLVELVNGDTAGLNLGAQLRGIELITQTTSIGGKTLSPGQLLLSLNGNALIGGLSVQEGDVAILTLLTSGSLSTGAASMLMRAADVGLTGGGETLDALALVQRASVAPTITVDASVLAYIENDLPTVIAPNAMVADADSSNFGGGSLSVYLSSNGTLNDRLAIRNEGVAATQIGVSGSDVTYSGVIIGSFSGGEDGTTPLVISLNANATLAATQALLRNITYANVSDDPSTLPRTASVVLTDGSGGVSSTVSRTISVTAANDAPTITGVTASTAIDDTGTATPFSGVVIGDVDSPAQTQTVSITLDLAAKGSLSNLGGGSYNAGTGVYSFSGTAAAATTAVQGLVFTPTANRVAPGSTETTTFTISVDDGVAPAVTDSTTTVVTTSVNDAPVAVVDTATAVEAGGVANGTAGINPTGNVLTNDTDVDSGDTKTVTSVSFGITPGVVGLGLAGAYGTLTLNADGSYSYAVNNSNATVQALRTNSDTLTEVFDYSMQDATGAPSSSTLTITITGSNDAPVTGADTASAVEAGGVANGTAGTNPTGNVLTNDTDVDSGDTKTVTAVSFGVTPGVVGLGLAGAYGTLTLNADGSYSYAVNNSNAAVQALRTNSDTLTEVFDYSMQDATGAPSSSTLTITITGSNDAPVTGADTATAVEAGGVANGTAGINPTGNVLTNDTDVDSSDSKTVTAVSFGATPGVVGLGLVGAYGTLTLNADGSYSYVVNNSNAAVQALRSSDSLTETFDYSLQDMAGALGSSTLTITITGSNDAPVITSSGTQVVVEASPATASVTASDVESDTLAFSITGGADAAWFTIDSSTGLLSLTFVPDYAAPKDANLDNLYEVIVTVNDGNGGTQTLAVQLLVADKIDPVATLPEPPAPPLPPAPEAAPDKEADTEETQSIATPIAPNEGIPKAAITTVASDASVTVIYQSATTATPTQMMVGDVQVNRNSAATSFTLVTLNQMLGGLGSDARALQMLQNSLDNGNFLQQLNQLQDTIRQQLNLDKNVVASTLAVSTGLSVGYVLWLVRGGVLLSSLLTSLPAWRLIDPLPILGHLAGKTANDDEDDSLEGMLKKSNEKIEPAPSDANEVTP